MLSSCILTCLRKSSNLDTHKYVEKIGEVQFVYANINCNFKVKFRNSWYSSRVRSMIFYRVILQKKVVLLNIQTWLKAAVLQMVKIGKKGCVTIKFLPYHSLYGGHIPLRKIEPSFLAVYLKKIQSRKDPHLAAFS